MTVLRGAGCVLWTAVLEDRKIVVIMSPMHGDLFSVLFRGIARGL